MGPGLELEMGCAFAHRTHRRTTHRTTHRTAKRTAHRTEYRTAHLGRLVVHRDELVTALRGGFRSDRTPDPTAVVLTPVHFDSLPDDDVDSHVRLIPSPDAVPIFAEHLLILLGERGPGGLLGWGWRRGVARRMGWHEGGKARLVSVGRRRRRLFVPPRHARDSRDSPPPLLGIWATPKCFRWLASCRTPRLPPHPPALASASAGWRISCSGD